MYLLTYDQLNSGCLATIMPVTGYQSELVLLMDLYYKSGVRPIEGVESNRWSVNLMGEIMLVTAKSGQVRYFDPMELPSEFVNALINARWPFPNIRISQAERFFSILFPYPTMTKGDKNSVMYAFRYRYVKWLISEGYPPSQVQMKMGWIDPDLVYRYGNAPLYVY